MGSECRKQGKEVSERIPMENVYIGIDVSKSWLDVYIHPAGLEFRVTNDRPNVGGLIRQITDWAVELIVVEATGKWHRRVQRCLHEARHRIAVVNPYRSRELADALGFLAKTDTIDARVLTLFAMHVGPRPPPPPSAEIEALKELVAARREGLREVTALKNRLSVTGHQLCVRQLQVRLNLLQRHLKALEKEIRAIITTNPMITKRAAIISSIPGVGPVSLMTLIAGLDELKACPRTQIAALTGVAPMNWDSGQMRGRRLIKGGKAHVRAVLYMTAVAAVRSNSGYKAFYKRLTENGKKLKVALTADMRKIVILANTLINEDRMWSPTPP